METNESVDLAGLGYSQIYAQIDSTKREFDSAKARLAKLHEELEARLGNAARKMLADGGKASGTVNMPLQGGLTAKVEVPKKIEWDSDKLFDLATAMSVERARSIFKFAVSVPEKIYDGIKAADPELGKSIDSARTTKQGAIKITLTKEQP